MQVKLYNKANSILGLAVDDGAHGRVLATIGALRTRLEALPTRTAEQELALTAARDALGLTAQPAFGLKANVVEELDRLDASAYQRYLTYRYKYDVYPAARRLDAYPPCVQIEPVSICNYRCLFCYQTDPKLTDKKNGHMGIMPLDRFKAVVDQLDGQVEAVTLASRGEPLVAPELPQMLAYMRGKFLASKLNTNASLLDERLCHALLEAGLQTLVFSADAADPVLYAKLRVNGHFDRVMKNIARFRDIRARHYPQSKLITRVSGVYYCDEQNRADMDRVWGEMVDQVIFVNYNPWVDIYNAQPSLVDAHCSDLWRRTFVWHDGRVNPCDVDYLSTLSPGTLAEASLSAIWTGEAYQTLRSRHAAGHRREMTLCRNCVTV